MTATEASPPLHLPARDVPIPMSVSAEARAIMAQPRPSMPPEPPVEDVAAWRARAAAINAAMLAPFLAKASGFPATVRDIEVDGVVVYDIVPHGVAPDDPRVYLDIHGGAYIVGYGDVCRAQATGVAGELGSRVWSVDYRTPPDHRFPLPLDDCLAVYRALVARSGPGNVIVGGTSAGGNLTAATILRARDEGLALPAGAVMHTPHLDMTNASDSLRTNDGLDMALSGGDMVSLRDVYAGGADITSPYLSPLLADLHRGFPPSFLSTGTRDRFLSDTVRFHAALCAADVRAELHVTEAASHGNFHGAPEEAHIVRETRKFIARCWDEDR
jgi:acetyl esterase/lipase